MSAPYQDPQWNQPPQFRRCPRCGGETPWSWPACQWCGLPAGAVWSASAPRKNRGILTALVVVIAAVVVIAVGVSLLGNRPPTTAVQPVAGSISRSSAVAFFTSRGFTGGESPLANGTARWLGSRPDGANGEVIGQAPNASQVTLTVMASLPSNELVFPFVQNFAPGGSDFFLSVIDDARTTGSDQNRSTRLGGRTLRVQATGTGDDYLIVVSVAP